MPRSIASILELQGFVILDGGLATELEKHGADLNHHLWSARLLAEAPELIRRVHLDYLRSGADVIATVTYQASFRGFARAGFGRREAERLMRLSVDLAREAKEAHLSSLPDRSDRVEPLIAASIGPYGASLHDGSEYHGNYGVGRDTLVEFHRPRMDLLAETEADLFAFETIPSLQEAEVLVELLAEYPGRDAWLSFSCRDGARVSHGEPFAECAMLADTSEQVVAVGINCTPPQYVSALLESAGNVRTSRVVYPNSGEHWVADDNRWAGEECGAFPVAEWYELGARLLGGCCRTGPDDIQAMRAILRRLVAER